MLDIEREFLSILRNLDDIGALSHLVLIGSWVSPIYAENLGVKTALFTTTDVDFSIRKPHDRSLGTEPSIHKKLLDIGYLPFIDPLSGSGKYIPALDQTRNQLSIDFVCEPGRIVRRPYVVPGLGVTAVPIRFQQVLLKNTEKMTYKKLSFFVPKPAFWAAHKIVISQLRSGALADFKMIKDLDAARIIVEFMGERKIWNAAETLPGKFLGIFRKGWRCFQDRRP